MRRRHVEFIDGAYLSTVLVRPKGHEQRVANGLAIDFSDDGSPSGGLDTEGRERSPNLLCAHRFARILSVEREAHLDDHLVVFGRGFAPHAEQ